MRLNLTKIFGVYGRPVRFNPARRASRNPALALAALLALPVLLPAQVIKGPRYSGTTPVEAPAAQLILPPLPPALTPHGTVVEDVVVQVNEQIISRTDLERSYGQLQQEMQENHVDPAQLNDMQKNVLRDMIDQQLLLSKAKELGLNADADVIRQLDDIRKKNNMASLDDLEKAARAQGVSFDDFKTQIRNQILTQQVVRDEVGRHLQMSPSDESKYYEAHKSEFQQPEQVRLSEILVPLPENATPAEIAQAETRANAIKSQLMQGADFADLAKKDSGGPSAAQGGELGMFKRGALAKVLEDQTFALKAGDTTQPIRTRQGFVILKVAQHDMAGPAPMKDVEQQIQEAMYMQQMQPALRVYLTKLRTEAYIDIQPGFVDSGATAGESRLINTAYVPPPIKKKKPVAVKARYTPPPAKAVVASPDATGSRTITETEAVDPNTGMARIAPTKAASTRSANGKSANGKVAKIRKEKVRLGQAPRDSIATSDEGAETAAVTTPVKPATPNAGSATPGSAAPGAELIATDSANLNDNPLTPKAPEVAKTRFAARAKEEKARKANTVTAKQAEKILAKPLPPSAEEKANEKIQAAPLSVGANDESKKAPKPRRDKDAPKERLAEKPSTPAPTAPAIEQTANPALAPTDATPLTNKQPSDKPTSDQTTLPPTNQLPPNTPPTTVPPPIPHL